MALEIPADRPSYSYEDYAAIDDGRRYQVLEGELVPMPSPAPRHQSVGQQLAFRIDQFGRDHKLGRALMDVDIVFKPERPAVVLCPDVMFIRRERMGIVGKVNIQAPPDLVVEVLSPSNARLDTMRKTPLYERFGVAELWIVSQEVDRIDVLRLDAAGRYERPRTYLPGDKLETPLLPGFQLDVAELFEAARLSDDDLA